ncbi:MAG: RseA family anti-sigma factor [Nevskiaceae bacterium]
MSEQDERASQLSAMFDGELPDAECELVARRLSRDPELRRSWANYGLIGAALRSEPLAPSALAPRVHAAWAAEVAAAADTPSSGDESMQHSTPVPERPLQLPRWAVPVSGVGVAAGLAAVAGFWWAVPGDPNVSTATVVPSAQTVAAPLIEEVVIAPAAPALAMVAAAPTAGSATAPGAIVGGPEAATSGEPVSYVTPRPNLRSSAPAVPLPAQLASFVEAHSAVSAPMISHSVISATMAVSEPETPPVEAEGR